MEEKVRVTPTILEISNSFNRYLKLCGKYESNINKGDNVKYIIVYGNILISYGEEIAVLYNNSWNNAISTLTRSFLECYSIVKNLIRYYNTSDFDEYIKYLYYVDIMQTLSTIKEYKKEMNKVKGEKIESEFLQNEIKDNLNNIKWILKKSFKEYKITDNNEDAVEEILNKIDGRYKNSKFNKSVTYNVSWALYNNKAWVKEYSKKYLGSKAVYGILCSSSHNNISSVYKRTIKDGMIGINLENDDIEPSLNIVNSCMKDINYQLEKNIFK